MSTETQNGAVATAPRREMRIVEDSGPVSFLMDTAKFEHCQRIALIMARGSLIPDHLKFERGNNKLPLLPVEVITANCFRIVNQALRWGMDPFAIVDETYVVGGKLGYQGKLVAAVVNSRAGLEGRLDYEFSGTGDGLTVRVIGRFAGESKDRDITLSVKDARTDNQMWRKDPHQKLIYSGVVKWARRHCPEVVLGVLTDDDLERMRDQSHTVYVENHHGIEGPQPSKSDRMADLLAAKKTTPEPEPEAEAVAEKPEPEEQPVEEAEVPEVGSMHAALKQAIYDAETHDDLTAIDEDRKTAARSKEITAAQSSELLKLIHKRADSFNLPEAEDFDDPFQGR